MDPTTGGLTVGLQNTSSKTIVGYGLVVKQLDETGKILLDSGVGWDFLQPEGDPGYILPGQPGTIWANKIVDQTVPVKVSVISVIYLDQTYEGPEASGAIFNGRMITAADIRKFSQRRNTHPPRKPDWKNGPRFTKAQPSRRRTSDENTTILATPAVGRGYFDGTDYGVCGLEATSRHSWMAYLLLKWIWCQRDGSQSV